MTSESLADSAVGRASTWLAVIGATAMLMMMMHVVVDVTGRYIFNNPLPGTLESVTYYYMVMVTALPFAYVTRNQGQITVEMFTSWLPQRWILLLDACAGALMFIYVAVLAYKIGQEAVTMTVLGEVHDAGTMQFTTWPSRWVPPIGFGVMACAVALRVIEDFKSFLRA